MNFVLAHNCEGRIASRGVTVDLKLMMVLVARDNLLNPFHMVNINCVTTRTTDYMELLETPEFSKLAAFQNKNSSCSNPMNL